MSQAWQIHPNVTGTSWRLPNALANLELREVEKPIPTPGTALVRMHAVAVNSRDLQVIAYDPVYPTKAQTAISPCSDGAGVVEAVGDGSIWTKGDRVILAPNSWVEGNDEVNFDIDSGLGGGNVQGALAQHKVVGDNHLFRAPANLTLEEAASLPTAGGIAAHALFFGPITAQEGTTVLTQGTGGLAAANGATVISTSSSDQKLDIARELGARYTINYKTTPDWEVEVLRLTNGKGVDHVIEVGGASTIEKSLASLRQGGLVSIIGYLTSSKKLDLVPAILFGAKIVRGVLGMNREMNKKLVELFEKHDLHPVIAKTFRWDEAKQALEALLHATEVGKIIISV